MRMPPLPPSLRLVSLPSLPASQVAYCGIAVHAGSRCEEPREQGLAHFCEHLAFKGTERRSAMRIINDIEGLGGELNAFTNKEDTVFYCVIERRHLCRAIDVLCDIVFHSQFPPQEVEKEREVVCDEIESYEDSPAELIYDEFENLLFEGHPLGHNILGSSAQVRSYGSDAARRFTQKWYRPENCVLFATDADALMRQGGGVSPCAAPPRPCAAPPSALPPAPAAAAPLVRQRSTHQAHVMMGTRAFSASDPRRWALYLLNNILGGPGLNSRLNLALRERHGLVYTVESTMASYSDTGLWAVYFGCDPHDADRCQRLVRRELDRLAARPLSARQLSAAKRQLRGQLAIASENREQMALDAARSFLHTGHVRTLADVVASIDALTAADLQLVAQQLFAPQRITTLIYT